MLCQLSYESWWCRRRESNTERLVGNETGYHYPTLASGRCRFRSCHMQLARRAASPPWYMSALSELRVLLAPCLYSPLFSSSSRGHLGASAGGPAVRVVGTCHSVPVGRLAGPALGPRVQHKGQSWTCWTSERSFAGMNLGIEFSLTIFLCA